MPIKLTKRAIFEAFLLQLQDMQADLNETSRQLGNASKNSVVACLMSPAASAWASASVLGAGGWMVYNVADPATHR